MRVLPRIATVFVVAVLVNYVWEVAQMPLYQREGSWLIQAVHCFVPGLGDGILVLLILGAGRIAFGAWTWTDRCDRRTIAVTLLTGLGIALTVEWVGLHVLRRWTYAESMPLLPALGVGLVPVLQMLVLPPLAFEIARWWLERKSDVK
jgi:hypothetical protein